MSFGNRRQIAAYAGLAATPWRSGSIHHEQGAFQGRQRAAANHAHPVALLWRRHQPQSALTLWFEERLKGGGRKKTLIVALARKLLVALWKFVTTGVVP